MLCRFTGILSWTRLETPHLWHMSACLRPFLLPTGFKKIERQDQDFFFEMEGKGSCNIDGGHRRRNTPVASCCDTLPVFSLYEHVFDEMRPLYVYHSSGRRTSQGLTCPSACPIRAANWIYSVLWVPHAFSAFFTKHYYELRRRSRSEYDAHPRAAPCSREENQLTRLIWLSDSHSRSFTGLLPCKAVNDQPIAALVGRLRERMTCRILS